MATNLNGVAKALIPPAPKSFGACKRESVLRAAAKLTSVPTPRVAKDLQVVELVLTQRFEAMS